MVGLTPENNIRPRENMKGDNTVIAGLNDLLTKELTAIDLYFLHSRMYNNWGLTKLFEKISHERDDEIRHADLLINRILFLEGLPNILARAPIQLEISTEKMIQQSLDYEIEVMKFIKGLIKTCEDKQDYDTRKLLQQLLKDTEEDHIYWCETQINLIAKIGLPRYLQSQI